MQIRVKFRENLRKFHAKNCAEIRVKIRVKSTRRAVTNRARQIRPPAQIPRKSLVWRKVKRNALALDLGYDYAHALAHFELAAAQFGDVQQPVNAAF